MSDANDELPERMLVVGASDFERRLLTAGAHEEPSAALSARMAEAIGVSAVAATALGAAATATSAATAKATAATTSTVWWPWVSLSVLGLAVAGAVVGTHEWSHPGEMAPAARPVAATAPSGASAAPAPPTAVAVPEPVAASGTGATRRANAVTSDLRDQIAMIDAARAAISAGGGERALQILHRYLKKYPSGSFRPEATALKIEALVKLGRRDEARTLAARFITEHRGSALADRVATVAGVTPP